jgi:hypothetical protein
VAHRLTDWAAAPKAQKKRTTGQSHGGKKNKCVLEQAALAKASRDVVGYVGNMEMPKWSDDNKESVVEAYAIALRYQLGYYMKHRVQHPPTAVEHIRHEAPPPAM